MEIRVFLLLILLWGGELVAQTAQPYSDEILLYRGERFMPFLDGPIEEFTRSADGFTGQQLQQASLMRENLSRLSGLVKGCPTFNPPQGFKLVINSTTLPAIQWHDNKALGGEVRMDLYGTMVCNERPCYDKKPDASVTFTINDPTKLLATHVIDDIWMQPRKVSDFFGYPVYRFFNQNRELTVISKRNLPIYIPVTREEFMLTLIRNFNELISRDQIFAALPETHETLLGITEEERINRYAEFEKAYEAMHRFDPLLARKLRINLETTERRLEESETDSSINITLAQFILMQVSVWSEGIGKLRAELNAMSISERRSQAHWSEAEAFTTSGLTPPGHPGSYALARLNPEYLDSSLPPTDIQLLVVDWHGDLAPYQRFRQGRSLQMHKLFEFSRCESSWQQFFELVSEGTP